MSIKLMTYAWETDLAANDKLVLLALADWANDEGLCWPSVAKLCSKTRASERTVQCIIKRLVEAGHVTRQERTGRGCRYIVHPRKSCTPADSAPPQLSPPTPAKVAPNTPKNHQESPPPPKAVAQWQSRKERVRTRLSEPVSTELEGECAEASDFRSRALEAIGEGAYRNLLQPCEAFRVGNALMLQVPSETLRRVILDRQREFGLIAIAAGFRGLHVEVLQADARAPAHRLSTFSGQSAGGHA